MTRQFSKFFGAVVQRHRDKQNVSQEVLAEIAGIHRTHVGFIERGEQSPSRGVARKVAMALGVSLASLIADAEESCLPDARYSERRRKVIRPRKRMPPG